MILVRPHPDHAPRCCRVVDICGEVLVVAEMLCHDDVTGDVWPAVVCLDIAAIEAVNVAFGG